MTGPVDDSYPSAWTPRHMQRQTGPSADTIEAILLAVDSYVSALPESEFRLLVERTRGPQ
jgi:hypothetical protein